MANNSFCYVFTTKLTKQMLPVQITGFIQLWQWTLTLVISARTFC